MSVSWTLEAPMARHGLGFQEECPCVRVVRFKLKNMGFDFMSVVANPTNNFYYYSTAVDVP